MVTLQNTIYNQRPNSDRLLRGYTLLNMFYYDRFQK